MSYNPQDNYVWDLPTRVISGPGVIKELKNEKMPGKKALIVTSAGKSLKANGSLKNIRHRFEEAQTETIVFEEITTNPTVEEIIKGVESLKENACDFVVGLGGGSCIDAARIIAAMAAQDEKNPWEFIKTGTGGKKDLKEKSLPYIAIPTSAGSGSEVRSIGMLSNPETQEKAEFKGDFASIAITDPELAVTVEPQLTAYQGYAALCHSLEGYFSLKRTGPAQMVEIAAIGNAAQFLPVAVEDGADTDARTKLAFAGTMCGYSMELGSCTSLLAMTNAFCGRYPHIHHGEALAMISESFFRFFIDRHACDDRFLEMSMSIGKPPVDPMDFIYGLKEIKEKCGLKGLKMSEKGIEKEDLRLAAKAAMQAGKYLSESDPLALSEDDIVSIYEAAYM